MDLRPFNLTERQIDRAATLLNYQPFILSDDLQTGAAYSWIHSEDPRVKPTFVFRRADYSADQWEQIGDANQRLRSMYDDLLDTVAERFAGGSLLDVACNNGYFPAGAELRGMRGVGMDLGDYSASVDLLNDILGTHAQFWLRAYDPVSHTLPIHEPHDVVVVAAILCHLPDPLHFLAAIGKVARRAILFWGQVIGTERLLVAYNPPHPGLSRLTVFPHAFNDNTRISRGLFAQAMEMMGFREVIELSYRPAWLPAVVNANPPQTLEEEIAEGSAHVALLAVR